MASGSGKNQDDTETKEPVVLLRLREESNAAAATEPPPSAPPLEVIPEEEEVHGSQEAGGRNPSATTATAAAAEQKGEETGSLFWAVWDPAGGKPPLPPRPPSFSRAGGPSSAIDLKDVFDELMLESQRERSVETDQKAEAEGTPRQQNEQVGSSALRPKKGKKLLWRKILDRIGISNRNYTIPHVNYKKLHITEIITHYNLLEMVAGRGVLFDSHALNLRRAYSEFRPVHGDGECFYRSFIFSYLEQVLHRQDTHEEHRLLAAVKGVARQHARLGWASEFSRSHKDMHHCFTVVA
ncbi:uncharacterized protein LOC110434359 [Sorghum bicolor]|uniref:uncharacterized protein LOC110434359 n=1 Tax=Sorghum bicolor TaxID=4558 RepID=UPI000B4244CE|nr:uncharacterized protein LOC110434359 [Sorghum bicolor]XP_021313913.1 uncharacterized protein LOC110434359 [Sorghum bicolor]|eukprot:XP_021313912.1 uncharacterized protein LOC110434359 [Sorghum bicolor]